MTEPIRVLTRPGSVPLRRGTSQSAGWDLSFTGPSTSLEPGETIVAGTGTYLELPPGTEAQVRSRSGLATKGIFVVNSPGTIDSDYRGEITVILHNLSKQEYKLEKNERIAQLVFSRLMEVTLLHTNDISPTERGSDGLGSTGKF